MIHKGENYSVKLKKYYFCNRTEDPDEVFDLRVTEDTIRGYEENGYIKCGEPSYRVVREDDDNHCGMSDQ